MKHSMNASLIYSLIGLASGLFYRDFTKLLGFTGDTRLSLVHGHYLALGVLVFLILLILEKQFAWSQGWHSKAVTWGYHVGLNLTGLGLLARGIVEVKGMVLSKGLNAAIAGVSGLGHMVLGICLVLILMRIRKSVIQATSL